MHFWLVIKQLRLYENQHVGNSLDKEIIRNVDKSLKMSLLVNLYIRKFKVAWLTTFGLTCLGTKDKPSSAQSFKIHGEFRN